MKINDFKKLNDYLGKDTFAYFVVKKNAFLESSDWRSELYQKIKEILPPEKMIPINVNFHKDGTFSLQGIPKGRKSNAILLRRDVLLGILESELDLEFAIAKRIIFFKDCASINRQAKRKTEVVQKAKAKKVTLKNNIKSILNGEGKYIPRHEWIAANKEVLTQKATTCERIVFNKLSKSLKNRVKKQTPFTINGNIYFADICIKCKKLIIEVDGGYHNIESVKNKDNCRDADFASIGYKTLRIKNDEAANPAFLSKFVKDIINTPNLSKQSS